MIDRRALRTNVLAILLAGGAAAAGMSVPLPAEVDPGGRGALAILGATVALLVASTLRPIAIAAIVVAGIVLTQSIADASAQLFQGFSSHIVFFLFGVVGIGQAVVDTGMARRLSAIVVSSTRSNPRSVIAQLIAALPLLPVVLPSAVARNAVLMPVYEQVMHNAADSAMRLRRAVGLVLGILNPMASSAILTGGMVSITAATLLGEMAWGQWFMLMAVPYYLLILLGAAVTVALTGALRTTAMNTPQGGLERNPRQRAEPWSRHETRLSLVMFVTLTLWLTDHWHGLPPAVPAVAALAALLIVGCISLESLWQRLPWEAVFIIGALLSLTSVIIEQGIASWLASELLGGLHQLGLPAGAQFAAIPILVIMATVVHIAVPNRVACLILLVPLSLEVAANAGLPSFVGPLAVVIAIDSIIFYPLQSSSNLPLLRSGALQKTDVLLLGAVMFACVLSLGSLAFLPYWLFVAGG